MSKIRVLVVDDSALVREILRQGLAEDPRIEVVGVAGDPYQARDKIVQLRPDVLTLDVEMPRMDGVEFLRRLMPHYPLPVVMVSALTEQGKQITLDALEAGAVDFVSKPKADMARGLNAMMDELRAKVLTASTAKVRHRKRSPEQPVRRIAAQSLAESTDKIVAIGASTGGTEAVREVVTRFPASFPGTVIVQHMPAGFTRKFAERLDTLSAMDVKEAEDKDRIRPGRVLVAPGGMHLRVQRSGGIYLARVQPGALINGHCPSVEALFDSVAEHVGANAVGVMLTGMGADGAEAMRRMREAGARCFAQDEASSVVFGMPREAFARGGAERLVPLTEMADAVSAALSGV
ncbi:protein-glutamate methylesterase/protein-glutamine glutaminase [Desulfonatronum thioautotrophicum]|uniref:protein-glutamate methylesterase/protein-glutamine glutaminase n=1 Tax=Desulfonatronum thioautotrophicum TaxID=617001 RepID=UPI0005EB26E7|nr:chemotaxis response regulator protein-glutamate methylesterase [Desulfonatronum thioautotrophicum]